MKRELNKMETEDKIKFFLELLEDYHHMPGSEFDKKYGTSPTSFMDDETYIINEFKKRFREELEE